MRPPEEQQLELENPFWDGGFVAVIPALEGQTPLP